MPNDEIIGQIEWRIDDRVADTMLGEGHLDVSRSDVIITRKRTLFGLMTPKAIRLTDHFQIALAEFPTWLRHDRRGFGFMADRTDIPTFSWEWFNIDKPGHAKKLQESGELAIMRGKTAWGWEITRTEFLTDVSMRVGEPRSKRVLDPPWRIEIARGSWINWPSLLRTQ